MATKSSTVSSQTSAPWSAEPASTDPVPAPAAKVEGAAPAEAPAPATEMPTLDTPEKVLAYLKENPGAMNMMSKQEIIAMFAGAAAAEEMAKKAAAGEAKGD